MPDELSEHFSRGELECHHCGVVMASADFLTKLERLREMVGFPLHVTSGYRCPEYNSQVSRTGTTGPHTTGRAVDIAVRGSQSHTLLRVALFQGWQGIGVSQKGRSRFIHLDDLDEAPGRPRPWVWSY